MVASAITPIRGSRTGPTGTLKNSTNSGSPRAVNTTAESRAVRVRNSSSRSLRAPVHACASSSRIGHGPPVRLGDLARPPSTARGHLHEPPVPLERHVGGELDTLVDVVRREHQHAPGAA